MDSVELISILEKARDAGIVMPAMPTWAQGTHYESSLEQVFVSTNDDKKLREFLVTQKELSIFDGKMFNAGNSQSLVSLDSLSKWLLFNTWKLGAEETVDRLARYLALGYNPAFAVLAITGVELDGPVQLDDELVLVPFSHVPLSAFKESLDPPFLKPKNLVAMGLSPLVMMNVVHHPPTAALLKRVQLAPQTITGSEMPTVHHDLSLYEACECLTLISSCTPLPAAHSHIVEDWVPCAGNLGSGWSSPVHDIVNMSSCRLTEGDKENAVDLYSRFKALPQSVREKLRVPIQRLNQARRRQNPADKAIDLGVAFESLYLGDRSEKEQISYTFRLRAAWHLGDSPGIRYDLIQKLNHVYNLRSKAVHSGKVDLKVTVCGVKMSVVDFIKEADGLCVSAINKVIAEQGFPDWDRLVLG